MIAIHAQFSPLPTLATGFGFRTATSVSDAASWPWAGRRTVDGRRFSRSGSSPGGCRSAPGSTPDAPSFSAPRCWRLRPSVVLILSSNAILRRAPRERKRSTGRSWPRRRRTRHCGSTRGSLTPRSPIARGSALTSGLSPSRVCSAPQTRPTGWFRSGPTACRARWDARHRDRPRAGR